ncbi:MAG TPA: ribosome maturation factor RimM [Xanthomonadaceae bacterium]|nr:ribosome maturation factor RimM [Xanthomonadaceae bacterium]
MSATADDRPAGPSHAHRPILLGRITGVFGVRGELKIESWTDPRDAIFRYQPWTLVRGQSTSQLAGVRGRTHGQALVASVPGVGDRDAAQAMVGYSISVPRSALPAPKDGEYYWVDLEGLSVSTLDGVMLGSVSHLLETGANHVLVVQGDRERLIPFVQPQYVTEVDFDARRIVVDWDPEF